MGIQKKTQQTTYDRSVDVQVVARIEFQKKVVVYLCDIYPARLVE